MTFGCLPSLYTSDASRKIKRDIAGCLKTLWTVHGTTLGVFAAAKHTAPPEARTCLGGAIECRVQWRGQGPSAWTASEPGPGGAAYHGVILKQAQAAAREGLLGVEGALLRQGLPVRPHDYIPVLVDRLLLEQPQRILLHIQSDDSAAQLQTHAALCYHLNEFSAQPQCIAVRLPAVIASTNKVVGAMHTSASAFCADVTVYVTDICGLMLQLLACHRLPDAPLR